MSRFIPPGLTKLFESSMFCFSVPVLSIALALVYAGKLEGTEWLTAAVTVLGILATKESARYVSRAIDRKPTDL